MAFRSLFSPQVFEPGLFSIRLAPFAPILGAGAKTLGALTATGAGSIVWPPVLGVGAKTLGSLTSVGAGTVAWPPITGAGAATLGAMFSTGFGTVAWPPITGVGAKTLGALTATGAAIVLSPITGVGAKTLGALTATGAGLVGFVPITGVGGNIVGGVVSSGTGLVQDQIFGAGASTLGALASFGQGTVVTQVLWTPANLATPPQYWYDGQDAASLTLASGNRVTRWANKGSQVGVDATQSINLRRPVLVSASNINGHPALRFDGAESLLTTTWSSYAGLNDALEFIQCDGSFSALSAHVTLSDGTPYAASAASLPSSLNAPSLIEATWSGSAVPIYQDGKLSGLGSPPLPVMRPGGVFMATRLASVGEGGAGHLLNWNSIGNSPARLFTTDGDIGELLYLDYEPVDADRQKIEGYMAWRWGTQAQLPAGHPYLDAPPILPSTQGQPKGLLLTLTDAGAYSLPAPSLGQPKGLLLSITS